MKFEKAKVGQRVKYGPHKIPGEITKLVPPDQAEIKIADTIGFCLLIVPVKDLKRVKDDTTDGARQKFSKVFTKTLNKTSGPMRKVAEQKKVKPERK